MTKEVYFESLEQRFAKYFDVEKEVLMNQEQVDLLATHKGVYGRTFISKVDIIDAYTDREIHAIKYFETPTSMSEEEVADGVRQCVEQVQKSTVAKKRPNNHRQTESVCAIVMSKEYASVRQYIENYQFQKSHCLGIGGWTNQHLVYIVLDTKVIYTSKKIGELQQVYML